MPIRMVKLPSGGLGLSNAKLARPLLPGAPLPAWDTYHAYTAEYPIPPWHSLITKAPQLRARDCEKRAGKDRENLRGNDRGALQNTKRFCFILQAPPLAG
jgi:hypothetical protein